MFFQIPPIPFTPYADRLFLVQRKAGQIIVAALLVPKTVALVVNIS